MSPRSGAGPSARPLSHARATDGAKGVGGRTDSTLVRGERGDTSCVCESSPKYDLPQVSQPISAQLSGLNSAAPTMHAVCAILAQTWKPGAVLGPRQAQMRTSGSPAVPGCRQKTQIGASPAPAASPPCSLTVRSVVEKESSRETMPAVGVVGPAAGSGGGALVGRRVLKSCRAFLLRLLRVQRRVRRGR